MLKWRKWTPALVLAISILALGAVAFTSGVEADRPDYATMNANRSTSAQEFIHPDVTAKMNMEAEVQAKMEAEAQQISEKAPEVSYSKDRYTGIASLRHPVVQHDPRTVYLSEDFEAETFPPVGWDTINTDPGYGFFRNMFSGGGTYAALVTWHGPGYQQDEWLLTPLTDISGMNPANAKLEFWMLQGYTYPHDFKIYWSTDGVTFTEFWDSFGTGYPAHVWYYVALDISSLIAEGSVMFGFQYYGVDANLFGLDDIAITDDAAATGRCCSGDIYTPTCTDGLTLDECNALSGSWINGGTCASDPCPTPGEDDICSDVTPQALPFTFVGNNEGATYDTYCQYFGDYPNTWLAFTIDECTDITLSYCGTQAGWGNGWLNLVTDCACSEGSLISGATYDFNCGNGNPNIYWSHLAAGTYYYPVMLDPANGASGDWSIEVTGTACPPAPANDDCANAEAIGDVVDYVSHNFGATTDGGGYANQNIWYCYTATCDGFATVSLCGSDFDTKLAAYDGCTCPVGTSLATNDDFACVTKALQSQITFAVTSGNQYMIEVGGYGSGEGNLLINISCAGGSGNEGDNCDNPIKLDIPTLPFEDLGQTTCGRMNYYEDPGDDICMGYYTNGEDIFYEISVLSEVTVNFHLDPLGTSYAGMGLFTSCPPTLDNCVDFVTSSSSAAKSITCVTLTAGTYYLMIDTWSTPYCITEFNLSIVDTTCEVIVIENDDCADATEINEVADLAFSTVDATFDGPGGCQTTANVWYCYTATQSGKAVISLCGSSYDTKLAVYEGCSCPPGTLVECNDDACGVQSEIEIPGVVAGNIYMIEVGGYSTNTGTGVLNITVVPDCEYECPPGATPEGEICLGADAEDVTNGGCNSDPAVFGSIACGETVCGEVSTYNYFGSDYRDTDWYGFTLTEWMNVTLNAEADFPFVTGFLEQVVAGGGLDCANFTGYIAPYASVEECTPVTLTVTLGPGTYALFAGASVFTGLDCATGPHNYHLQLTCVPAVATYCEASGGCDEYIENITVGSINNTTACEGYGDFTALSTSVEAGGSYPISFTIGSAYSSDQGAVWVDWNQDMDFDDPGEQVLTGVGYGPYTGDMVVPGDALAGATRMRARLTWNATPAPCGATSYGEAEDYTIIVGEAAPTVLMVPDPFFAAFMFALDPMSGSFYMTNTAAGGDVNLMTVTSLSVGGCPVTITGSEVIPGGYGTLIEDCIKVSFPLSEYLACEAALQPDGLLWDHIDSFFDITYEIDGVPGSYTGQVEVIGHISGDLNMDGKVLVDDLTFFVNYLFKGGDEPRVIEIADCDASGGIPNVADIVYVVSYLFKGGPAPVHP